LRCWQLVPVWTHRCGVARRFAVQPAAVSWVCGLTWRLTTLLHVIALFSFPLDGGQMALARRRGVLLSSSARFGQFVQALELAAKSSLPSKRVCCWGLNRTAVTSRELALFISRERAEAGARAASLTLSERLPSVLRAAGCWSAHSFCQLVRAERLDALGPAFLFLIWRLTQEAVARCCCRTRPEARRRCRTPHGSIDMRLAWWRSLPMWLNCRAPGQYQSWLWTVCSFNGHGFVAGQAKVRSLPAKKGRLVRCASVLPRTYRGSWLWAIDGTWLLRAHPRVIPDA